jgi:MFS family permease
VSGFKRGWIAAFYDAFYWIGIVMSLACFAAVLAGNTEVLWRFEHTGFPMSWAFGVIAVLAFLAAEVCPPPPYVSAAREEEYSLSPEWEAVEY